jgi:lysophospholipase L1-like esterase
LNEKLGLQQYRVIEEGMCGRTTVFDDPFRDHRNGAKFVNAVLETHGASDLIILMLGTNDCKTAYKTTPQLIGKGVETVIAKIRSFAPDSKILLVSPIHLGEKVWEKSYDPEFSRESVDVSKGLADVYAEIARNEHLYFLDASDVAAPSDTDQEHLNEEGHAKLAEAIYEKVDDIFAEAA